jgi:hypothetical protein
LICRIKYCFLVFEQGMADVERGELDDHRAGITILGWDGESLVDGEVDERSGVGVNVTWLLRLVRLAIRLQRGYDMNGRFQIQMQGG